MITILIFSYLASGVLVVSLLVAIADRRGLIPARRLTWAARGLVAFAIAVWPFVLVDVAVQRWVRR